MILPFRTETKETLTPSLFSNNQVFVTSATEPSSMQQMKWPITLQQFVVGQDLTSKSNAVPVSHDIAKLAVDKSTGLVSLKQPKNDEIMASIGTSATKMTGDSVSLPLLDPHDSPSALASEVFVASPLNAVPKFTTRRSQSTKTFQLHANQCQTYLKHICNESNKCSVRHDLLPYLWRVQDAGKWVAFDENINIEQAFCNPNINSFIASYQVRIFLCN